MPYKSDAQRRFFHAAQTRGEIPASTVKEFDQSSKGKKLPEYKDKHIKRFKKLHKMLQKKD